MAGHSVTVTKRVTATPEQVWAALTEPDVVASWMMGARVDSTWDKGAPITWSGEWEGKPFTDKGEVVAVDPPRRLEHTHYSAMSGAPDTPANYHDLTWTLEPVGGGTELTLVQGGASSAEEAEQFAGTWSMMLDQLAAAVERQ